MMLFVFCLQTEYSTLVSAAVLLLLLLNWKYRFRVVIMLIYCVQNRDLNKSCVFFEVLSHKKFRSLLSGVSGKPTTQQMILDASKAI
jgi:hypothetical protein